MSGSVQLSDGELSSVLAILKKFLPPDTKVYVFGSRAKGTARTYSDLDLAIDHPLPLGLRAKLQNAFEESNLPWMVDLIALEDLQSKDDCRLMQLM